MKYRTLKPDDLIRNDDEHNRWGEWEKFPFSFVGRQAGTISWGMRRPVTEVSPVAYLVPVTITVRVAVDVSGKTQDEIDEAIRLSIVEKFQSEATYQAGRIPEFTEWELVEKDHEWPVTDEEHAEFMAFGR